MKHLPNAAALIVSLIGAFTTFSQSLILTGPASASYCDAEDVSFTAYVPLMVDDAFDDIDWRYRFTWYVSGSQVYTYTDDYIANNTATPAELGTYSGNYQVKLEVQFKFGLTWLTNQTLWSNTIAFSYSGSLGSYDPAATAYRMVSGDFDRDGKEDDVAALYDYGGTTTTLHVWKSNGSQFTYQGDNGWWTSTAFDADKIAGKVVSGDFDRDGYKDDVAAFYQYSGAETRAFVWLSSGTSFSYPGTWYSSGVGMFDASKITGRVVSGDFDRDGFKDDVTALYEYSGFATTAFVWLSGGSTFSSPGTWYSSGSGMFDAAMTTGNVVSGDFDQDTKPDDVTSLYNYGGYSCRFFTWESTASSYSGPYTMWEVCNPSSGMAPMTDEGTAEAVSDISVRLFPNPSNGSFSVSLEDGQQVSLEVLSVDGGKVLSVPAVRNGSTIDLSGEQKGIYYVKITANGSETVQKLVVQ